MTINKDETGLSVESGIIDKEEEEDEDDKAALVLVMRPFSTSHHLISFVTYLSAKLA